MKTRRVIGRTTMTALVVNSIIGSAIFGVPSEAIRLVGHRSVQTMLCAAALMAFIMLPIAEVASRFSRPGGLYLYARTAFGRFVGLQIGWFWLLAIVGGGAATVNLFLSYFSSFLPSVGHGWPRMLAAFVLVVIPAAANYVGVRQGAFLAVLFTIAKLLPLILVIVVGLYKLPTFSAPQASVTPDWTVWPKALLILLYAFSGWEDALLPTGEVREPERTVPFALLTSLAVCALLYTLFQLVVVQTAGTTSSGNAVVETVSKLFGARFVPVLSIAVMLSTFGWLAGGFLSAPRFPLALVEHGDSPEYVGRLHPKFNTPYVGVVLYAIAVFILAVTGSFIWAIELTAGALTIFYSIGCLALFRLRKSQPSVCIFQAPAGPVFATLGVLLSAALLTQLELRQISLMSLTCLLACANWLWARGREEPALP
jgi:basic amino acid/polyamine antiporter, APA family